MKKLILVLALLCAGISMQALTHTVGRGETLATIAQRYNITVEQLVEANPGIDKLFFAGQKLNIPETTASNVQQNGNQNYAVSAAPVDGSGSSTADSSSSSGDSYQTKAETPEGPGISWAMMLQYGFLGDDNFTFSANIGANYFFFEKDKSLFAGARIGWFSGHSLYSESVAGYSESLEFNTHFVTIPVTIGYAITTSNKKFGLTPYVALIPNFCVSSKLKSKSHSHGHTSSDELEFKKKVGLELSLGGAIRLWEFNIGAAYNIPLNDNQKFYIRDEGYVSISIGWGF